MIILYIILTNYIPIWSNSIVYHCKILILLLIMYKTILGRFFVHFEPNSDKDLLIWYHLSSIINNSKSKKQYCSILFPMPTERPTHEKMNSHLEPQCSLSSEPRPLSSGPPAVLVSRSTLSGGSLKNRRSLMIIIIVMIIISNCRKGTGSSQFRGSAAVLRSI